MIITKCSVPNCDNKILPKSDLLYICDDCFDIFQNDVLMNQEREYYDLDQRLNRYLTRLIIKESIEAWK